MHLRKFTSPILFVVAAMTIGAATSHADPAARDVNYELKLVDQTIVTTIDAGNFAISNDGANAELIDDAGAVLLTMPLSFTLDHVAHPYAHEVKNDGKVLELTPILDPATLAPSVLRPAASLLENQRAMTAFSTQLGIASQIGALTGLVVGAIVGCLFGLPLFGVGCIPGIAAGAGLGAVIGTIAAGGPTLIGAGMDLLDTLNAPPGTTKWNYAEPR
ncbi:ammonium transporter [Antrihabitans stalactiti]|uniref:Ammonium transporter n=1 Tax=Antrihabitans stalactiti TaxID=2584121 RepID=A0A848KJ44_9NOCA|nr:ammonium transporter [Antrihabitans stalactiti]NMN98299.1 ammonium transporter [Antrihabitans stalactiti]